MTGQVLSRSVAFQFSLDPTVSQHVFFARCAGARRTAFNHHVARVKEILDARDREKECRHVTTPSLSWSGISFINEFNTWKNGQLDTSPENKDGSRGLAWPDEVASDVFACASVDAAAALRNWRDSRKKVRKGPPVGFVRFSSKNRALVRFRLRNRQNPGETQSIRCTDSSHLRLPKIGEVRVLGPAREVRRMTELGRFHFYSAALTRRGGRWICSLTRSGG